MNRPIKQFEFANNLPSLDVNVGVSKKAISVIGLGYVGAVSMACLGFLGHRVVGADVDQDKVDTVGSGQSPIVENKLDSLLQEALGKGILSATTNVKEAVAETDVTFVSVGTPTSEEGGCDTRAIEAVARSIGESIEQKDEFHVVVLRCSVPPGTTLTVMKPIIEEVSGKVAGRDFGICFNPEFLREGTAVDDFHEPPKTVIGVTDPKTSKIMAGIYAPVDQNPIVTTVEIAELVKYVDNVWHATKVCFANEVGRLCKPLDIDSHSVMDIFVQDTKLNLSPYYLKLGFAFGGSCLPKEVRAVSHLAAELDVDLPLIDALIPSNARQVEQALALVAETGAKKAAVLGVAFKPGTDDLRESPSLELISGLQEKGVEVTAYDPALVPGPHFLKQFEYMQYALPHLKQVTEDLPEILRETILGAVDGVDGVDAIVVVQKMPNLLGLLEATGNEATVIDLVRMAPKPPTAANYIGIGW